MKQRRYRRQPATRRQRGMTLIVVLIMLLVLLLGGLASIRMDETGLLASGNFARGEAAVQASDVGVNAAFAELKALASDDVPAGTWYFPAQRGVDSDGLTQYTETEWMAARSVDVGQYKVSYLVDRQCNTAPITDEAAQCLLKQQDTEIVNAGGVSIAPTRLRVYRVTVRVTGPKNSVSWVQALVTKG